jgi:hypothetical protein
MSTTTSKGRVTTNILTPLNTIHLIFFKKINIKIFSVFISHHLSFIIFIIKNYYKINFFSTFQYYFTTFFIKDYYYFLFKMHERYVV